MEKVLFINIEDNDDLILSFVIPEDEYLYEPGNVKSLILLRSPKYEFALFDDERGVHVTHEDFPDDDAEMLHEITFHPNRISIRSSLRTYDLDTTDIDPTDLEKTIAFLQKMNFDDRFKIIRL